MTAREPLLAVRHLVTEFRASGRRVRAVNDVSFDVQAGETLAIVGESGSGKSITMLSIMRLVPQPQGSIAGGEIWFEGRNLLALEARAMRAVRGAGIAMIFQDPASSLNPVLTVGDQVVESLRLHDASLSRRRARARTVELLEQVNIANPARVIDEYPHRLSGGMCQRVMLAIAISGRPRLLIADEPTTALDSTTQLQLLELVRQLQRDRGMAVIWISHDLGVVAGLADRVQVMYAGRVVESAPAAEFYGSPRHPYSRALLRCVPRIDRPLAGPLPSIDGTAPDLASQPAGCAFAPRCNYRVERCMAERPPLLQEEALRARACWIPAATVAAPAAATEDPHVHS